MKSDEEVLAELAGACDGLLMMSESEYPFETFRWEGAEEVSPAFLRGLTGHPEGAPVSIISPDRLFRFATSEKVRRSEAARAQAEKYERLLRVLRENLRDLKVYRVGEVNIPVYVVGRSEAENWLGLSTRVVET